MIKYLIVDPEHHYENFQKADFVCYRNNDKQNFEEKAKIFMTQAKNEGIENIFLSEHYLLAAKLGADGVHLLSHQYIFVPEAQRRGLKVLISCRTEAEIEEAIRKKVDYVVYSPVLSLPERSESEGLEDLTKMVSRYRISIIASGGIITPEQVEKVRKTGASGFASVRFFTKKS